LLTGNLGRAVIKVSAVKEEHQIIEAPAVVFDSQNEFQQSFDKGELEKDLVAVIRFQGPRMNGMPELHKLTPLLGVLQDKGFKVAIVTDGRMSGASGKVPAAIHLVPEASDGGLIAKVKNGDLIRVDAKQGTVELLIATTELDKREAKTLALKENTFGTGREIFKVFRQSVTGAEQGASIL
ncbi:MAG: dihydroxy-acid dehydratase, partial [Kangiellaceae bacterium]|nr:dihydroxy-acid dehydratase [Kangiellaceae bacterium]